MIQYQLNITQKTFKGTCLGWEGTFLSCETHGDSNFSVTTGDEIIYGPVGRKWARSLNGGMA